MKLVSYGSADRSRIGALVDSDRVVECWMVYPDSLDFEFRVNGQLA